MKSKEKKVNCGRGDEKERRGERRGTEQSREIRAEQRGAEQSRAEQPAKESREEEERGVRREALDSAFVS